LVYCGPGKALSHFALLHAAKEAAHQLGIDPVEVEVAGPNDIENAFERLMRERVGAVEALQAIEFYRVRARIAELGLKHRMPIITGEVEFARSGGLVNMDQTRAKPGARQQACRPPNRTADQARPRHKP
jgi:ABC-type uncharacterized transport system substrate-binding protein